ncbi:MAG: HD domain-containing protein [Deltaproteobacteria bacterium]|jgi:dGTPase|nr:HD domain-containing protein [Deltaproteobacteria bacterium]
MTTDLNETNFAASQAADPFQTRRETPSQRVLNDLRPIYAIDVDRILHSQAYTRYIDKTQVFYLLRNSHITHRVIHVQMVSRIARTVGQKLNLNLDLIEAAALGHDLGHAPFGHDGEAYLSELCQEASIGRFVHAVMSLRCLERLEKSGRGLNLTLGVLDAILCHDGESDFSTLAPEPGEKSFAELDRREKIRITDPNVTVRPMTREGCLVRLCDTVSYVGRDLEDAIEVGLIDRDQLPDHVTQTLGSTNGTIVYKLVENIIEESKRNPEKIAFSPEIAKVLIDLKNFNREKIYYNPKIKREAPKIKRLYRILFETFLEDFIQGPFLNPTKRFLKNLDQRYREEEPPEIKTRDFLATLTDDVFLHIARELTMPRWRSDSI